ncbi:hypothetical protein BSNK01_08750 [Bacillaceae bacterium]
MDGKKPMKIMQIAGYANSGKTTLICKLIARLRAEGFRVGTVKHDGHAFALDFPGKDTWKHREAGAEIVGITSPSRTAWIEESTSTLQQMIERVSGRGLDYLLVEGFKREAYPKIVLLRGEEDVSLLRELRGIVAAGVWPSLEKETLQKEYPFPFFVVDEVEKMIETIRRHSLVYPCL